MNTNFTLPAHILLWVDHFAQTKISEDNMPIEVQKYVLQFEVSVDNPQLREAEEQQLLPHTSHTLM